MKRALLCTAVMLLNPLSAHADFCDTVKALASAVENEDTSYLPAQMTLNGAACEYDEGYEPGSVMDAGCLWYDTAKTAASSAKLPEIYKEMQACTGLTFKGRSDDGKEIKYKYEYGDWVEIALGKSGAGGVYLRVTPTEYY